MTVPATLKFLFVFFCENLSLRSVLTLRGFVDYNKVIALNLYFLNADLIFTFNMTSFKFRSIKTEVIQ